MEQMKTNDESMKTSENSENSVVVETNQQKSVANNNEGTPLITVNGNESRAVKPVARKDMKLMNSPHHAAQPSAPSVLKTVTTESLNKAMTQQIQFMNASVSNSSVWQKPLMKKDNSSKPGSQNLHVVSSSLTNTSSTQKPRLVAVIVKPVVSSTSTSGSNMETKMSITGGAQVQKGVVVRPILTSTAVSKPQFQCTYVKDKTISTVSSKPYSMHGRTMVSVVNSSTMKSIDVKPLLAPALNVRKQNVKVNSVIKNTHRDAATIKISSKSSSVKLPELQNVLGGGEKKCTENIITSLTKVETLSPKDKTELKPTMPVKLGLSKSLGSVTLGKALNNKSNKVNLSKSCFGAIRMEKGPPDDDLTSLKWLQRNDILKTFDVSQNVGSMSPPHDSDADMKSPFTAHSGIQNDGYDHSASCSQRQNSPSKPPYSFSSLIFMAIEDSSSKKLPVKDIYNWITDHFPYYRHAQSGWKNSVRHNLSLNKCFKKVDKERGQHGIGKGSLWCVDPSFRPNLLQALRKTQPFQPYPQFSTPPPSPHNGEPLSSSTPIKGGANDRRSVIQGLQFSPRVSTPEIDPELEAEAAATMCMIGTPPELRAMQRKSVQERSQSCPTVSGGEHAFIPQGYHQRHRGSFSGPISTTVTEKRKRNKHERAATTGSINIKRVKQEFDSSSLVKATSLSYSTDGEFEFDAEVDSDSEDEYTDDDLLNMSQKDGLSDSGYGQDLGRTSKKLRKYSESDDKLGADALLQLATSACHLQPVRANPVNGVSSPSTC